MLFESNFSLLEDNQEFLPLDTEGFQYLCKHARLKAPFDQGFSWHWHAALEIDYIMEGEVDLRTADSVQHIRKGEAFFVNSNMMHDIQLSAATRECEIYAHLFSPQFLSGAYNNLLEQKYILPVLKSSDLQTFIIRPDYYNGLKMIENILQMIQLSREETFGYELKIRSELSEFWCLFLKETENLRTQNMNINTQDISRLKQMIEFIRHHYMEKITLKEIADAANISTRECARCFQKGISSTPVNYLTSYRIDMAAQKLIYTDDSIMSISENCGFSSSSYMGKVFFDLKHCTPKEYRKQKKEPALH